MLASDTIYPVFTLVFKRIAEVSQQSLSKNDTSYMIGEVFVSKAAVALKL